MYALSEPIRLMVVVVSFGYTKKYQHKHLLQFYHHRGASLVCIAESHFIGVLPFPFLWSTHHSTDGPRSSAQFSVFAARVHAGTRT